MVGLHQGSVLSPLLFATVTDVVSSEARSGLPSELLYTNDLVLMVPTMEQLGRREAEWRASLLDKRLKVNAGKSKAMVGSSGVKMIGNSGKWHCGVSGKGVQASSSCHQSCAFHLSAHFFAISLKLLRSSNEQGSARRVHCFMCAVFSFARPHSHVGYFSKYPISVSVICCM